MKFLKKLNLFDIGDIFKETINRFTFSFVCAFFCFTLGITQIYDLVDISVGLMGNAVLLAIIGFFWCGVVQLYRESHSLSKSLSMIISIAGMIFFYLLVFVPGDGAGARLFSIVGALVILVSAVPFVFNKYDDLSFWSFNRKVGFGIAIAFIASLILFGGASAALASIGYLFEVKIPENSYATLWLFGATLLAPLYALSFIPTTFKETVAECDTPKQVGFIANWILAPLVAVYMGILYAYFAKIGITGDVPKGQLALMITGFSIAGIITYLLSWPFVFDGQANKLLKGLMQWFFPLMIIPVLVLFYAIYLRVNQYGFTEQRYILLIAALWFGFLAVGYTLKKLQLKHMTLSLAVLLLFGSWGPWGMYSVSKTSQENRLEAVLIKNNLLEDGKIVKVNKPEDVSLEDRVDITSRVNYLMRHNRDFNRRNKEKNSKKLKEVYGFTKQKDFFDSIGFEQASAYQLREKNRVIEEGKFNFNFGQNYGHAIDVVRADYFVSSVYTHENSQRKVKLHEKEDIVFTLEDNNFIIVFPAYGELNVPLTSAVKQFLKENPKQERLKMRYELNAKGSGFDAILRLNNISGDIGGDGQPEIRSLSAQVLITLK